MFTETDVELEIVPIEQDPMFGYRPKYNNVIKSEIVDPPEDNSEDEDKTVYH